MASKTYLEPDNPTRLSGEVSFHIKNMREVLNKSIELRGILGQIQLDGGEILAEKLGFSNPEDATMVVTLLSSSCNELENSPFFQQAITRIG